MESIQINSTTNTPQVDFFDTGSLKLEGRSFSEDPKGFWEPLITWCQQLSTECMYFEVKLDYVNTSSTKYLLEIIRTIDANSNIQNKKIKWYFEEDDDDMLEVGQIIEENTLATRFYYHALMDF